MIKKLTLAALLYGASAIKIRSFQPADTEGAGDETDRPPRLTEEEVAAILDDCDNENYHDNIDEAFCEEFYIRHEEHLAREEEK